jgi:hypothetical protein
MSDDTPPVRRSPGTSIPAPSKPIRCNAARISFGGVMGELTFGVFWCEKMVAFKSLRLQNFSILMKLYRINKSDLLVLQPPNLSLFAFGHCFRNDSRRNGTGDGEAKKGSEILHRSESSYTQVRQIRVKFCRE